MPGDPNAFAAAGASPVKTRIAIFVITTLFLIGAAWAVPQDSAATDLTRHQCPGGANPIARTAYHSPNKRPAIPAAGTTLASDRLPAGPQVMYPTA